MLHVGLTGNIASGKSCVSRKFAKLGAHIIDADRIAHELLASGTKTHKKVREAFGDTILSNDGSIDRKVLGNKIFCDPEKRFLLNGIIHPVIGEEVEKRIIELERITAGGIVIVEGALIVETGSYERYHRLIVVSCDPEVQVSRLVNRDNLSLEEAKARIDSQMPVAEKLKLADYLIDTSGTLKQTQMQVESIYRDLLVWEMPLNDGKE